MRWMQAVAGPAVAAALLAGGGAPSLAAAPWGGSVLTCMASGLLFGAAVLSGNVLAAAGAVVGALSNGCL